MGSTYSSEEDGWRHANTTYEVVVGYVQERHGTNTDIREVKLLSAMAKDISQYRQGWLQSTIAMQQISESNIKETTEFFCKSSLSSPTAVNIGRIIVCLESCALLVKLSERRNISSRTEIMRWASNILGEKSHLFLADDGWIGVWVKYRASVVIDSA